MELPLSVDLKGKVAVITGAGGVLCGCIAKALACSGAKVALLDINAGALAEVVREINEAGGKAVPITCDVLDQQSVRAARQQVLNTYGSCDILINGAGGNNPKATTDSEIFSSNQMGREKTFFDIQKEGLEFVFDLNFIGTFLPIQEFARDMITKEQSNIINIASVNTWLPLTKVPAYAAAKEAVGNFTKWLATYFSAAGIRVNAIAPGFLATNQTKTLFYEEDGETPTKRLAKIIDSTPMKRLGEPQELLGALLFLLSDSAASFITGAIIPVDGGFTAYGRV